MTLAPMPASVKQRTGFYETCASPIRGAWSVPASGDYYVVWRPDHPRQPAITAFRDWLVAAITGPVAD